MPTEQALRIADERSLDLVEVAPAAAPPVCRLMDYGRFRYEATRKERDARKLRKGKATNELREVRFKTRIGLHDRSAKTRMVKRLLEGGSKVKVSVMFRGREIDHPELGMGLLKAVAVELVDDALLEKAPGFEGRWLTMILAPNPKREDKADVARQEPDTAEAAQEPDTAEAGQEPGTAEAGQESDTAEAGQEPDTAEAGQEPGTAETEKEPEGAKA